MKRNVSVVILLLIATVSCQGPLLLPIEETFEDGDLMYFFATFTLVNGVPYFPMDVKRYSVDDFPNNFTTNDYFLTGFQQSYVESQLFTADSKFMIEIYLYSKIYDSSAKCRVRILDKNNIELDTFEIYDETFEDNWVKINQEVDYTGELKVQLLYSTTSLIYIMAIDHIYIRPIGGEPITTTEESTDMSPSEPTDKSTSEPTDGITTDPTYGITTDLPVISSSGPTINESIINIQCSPFDVDRTFLTMDSILFRSDDLETIKNDDNLPPLCEYIEDFEKPLGVFNQKCSPETEEMERALYKDHFLIIPDNYSQYFLTSNEPSCIQTTLYNTSYNVEVILTTFRLKELNTNLEVRAINQNGVTIENITIKLDTNMDWSESSMIFNASEPFRIRLVYNTGADEYSLAINSIAIKLFEHITTEPPETFKDCMRDNMDDDSPGLLQSQCYDSSFSDFVKLQYSTTSVFDKPLGANDWFMTNIRNGTPSCTISPIDFSMKPETEVVLSFYTDNEDGEVDYAVLFALNANNHSRIVKTINIDIDNSRRWRTVSFKMDDYEKVVLKLLVEPSTNSKAFFAIDYVGIKEKDAEDCITTCQYSKETCARGYAAVGDQQSVQSLGSVTTIIVSTTAVVSLLWGAIIMAFVFGRNIKPNDIK